MQQTAAMVGLFSRIYKQILGLWCYVLCTEHHKTLLKKKETNVTFLAQFDIQYYAASVCWLLNGAENINVTLYVCITAHFIVAVLFRKKYRVAHSSWRLSVCHCKISFSLCIVL